MSGRRPFISKEEEHSDKVRKIEEHHFYAALPKVWRKLRSENEFAPQMKKRKRKIRLLNALISIPMGLQRLLYNHRIRKVEVKAPVFILGHWRSGTTHLQYLLSQDPQWTHHDNFQSVLFNVALLTRGFLKPWTFKQFPTTRRMDNMKISPDKPGEEEIAFGAVTHRSGLHSLFFPKNRSYFEKYLFPSDLPPN